MLQLLCITTEPPGRWIRFFKFPLVPTVFHSSVWATKSSRKPSCDWIIDVIDLQPYRYREEVWMCFHYHCCFQMCCKLRTSLNEPVSLTATFKHCLSILSWIRFKCLLFKPLTDRRGFSCVFVSPSSSSVRSCGCLWMRFYVLSVHSPHW